MFSRQKLPELVAEARTDLAPAAGDVLRRSDAEVLARVHAGGVHGLLGYLDWLSLQLIPETATDPDWIVRHAQQWLQVPRKPAAAATGMVRFTGVTGAGIDAGVELQAASGVLVVVTAPGVIGPGGSIDLAAAAAEQGVAGNLADGVLLSLVSPVPGVQSQARCLGFGAGADQESLGSVKARTLERTREPPHGGASSDYVRWAKEMPGVTRAWVVPVVVDVGGHSVTVRVDVLIVCDDAPTGPFPDQALIDRVAAHIETVRPVTADCRLAGPEPLEVPIEIDLEPDTPAVRAAVTANLVALFRRCAPGVRLPLTHIAEAISRATGEDDHVLHQPTSTIVPTRWQMPTLGAIVWR